MGVGDMTKAEIDGVWISDDRLLITLHIGEGHKSSFIITEDNLKTLEAGNSFDLTEGISNIDSRHVEVIGNKIVLPILYNDMMIEININTIFDVAETAPIKAKNPGATIAVGDADTEYNPNDPNWQGAVKQAENFNMKEAKNFNKKTLDLPTSGEPVPHIGQVAAIIYTSNKEGLGPNQQYIHEFHEPLPNLLLYGPNGKPVYIIEGGKTKISEAGDDSGEAPGWMIQ